MGLSRGEFFSRIGMLKEIDPLTSQAYRFVEKMEAEAPRQGHQHDAPWHVSFHGSEFPGDSQGCGRRAIYTLMDIPRGSGLFPRQARQRMDAGKDLETQLVTRWYQAGTLVSAPPDSPTQTQFIDPEHWLTCTVDAIVVQPRAFRPIVAEVKNIDDAHVEEMLRMTRKPHEPYVRQVKTEIGLAHEYGPWKVLRCINSGRMAVQIALATVVKSNGHSIAGRTVQWMCPEHGGDKCLHEATLEPVMHGYLYYASRNDPAKTREYYYEYDPDFMRKGRDQLKVWRRFFENGVLPATQVTGKHPYGWNWTTDDSPCKWCPYGSNSGNRVCREDHDESVKRGELLPLEDSEGIELAQELRPDYDYGLARDAVFARWSSSSETAEASS